MVSTKSGKNTNGKWVFLSYADKDKEFAHKLGQSLEGAGVNVWLAHNELSEADKGSRKMEEGLNKCQYFCLAASPESFQSPRLKQELSVALIEYMSPGVTLNILPLRIEECELPHPLSDFEPVDFFNSYDEGFATLQKHLEQ